MYLSHIVFLHPFLGYVNMLLTLTSSVFSVLTSSVVDRAIGHRSGQTKYYKIGIWCFSAKHAALRRTSKDWLARNQKTMAICLSGIAVSMS